MKDNKKIDNNLETSANNDMVKTTKKGKIKNVNAFKKGAYSAAIIVIFCLILVAVNLFSLLLANNYSTTIDFTENNSFKLTDSNIEYIKKFNELDNIKNIEIILCATKAGYTGTEMVNYAYNYYNVTEDNTPDNYFNQTVRLLEEYPKYCSKISLKYVDPQEPSFEKLESESDVNIAYGDVIVRTTKADGTAKSEVLNFVSLYEVQTNSNYYSSVYTIILSNVENAVSGALNKTAMGISKKAAVIAKNCNPETFEYLKSNLTSYDYSFSTLEGTLSYDAVKEYDLLVVSSIVNDFDSETLKVFDKFLENDGKLGKSLLYIASQSSPATPNFDLFLNDWGIKQNSSGIVYETNSDYHFYNTPTTLRQFIGETEHTNNFSNTEKYFYSSSNVPFSTSFESKGTRTVNVLLKTSETAVTAPKGTSKDYSVPSNASKKSYPTIILSEDSRLDANDNDVVSSVIALASSDIIAESWAAYSDSGNMSIVTQTVNSSVGRENDLYFTPKGVTVTGIANPAGETVKVWFMIIFVIVLPVLCVVGGVFVWMRRIKR